MMNQSPSTPLASLEPASVWRFFAGIAKVPRPSKHEEQIREHVRQIAQALGFGVRQDRAGNLALDVPATPGHENAPPVVLQGHLDMVCEKNAGTQYDFERDPIRPLVDEDPQTHEPIVRADGTTLGADNGIGLALALSAASSPGVVHGPLEILCTVDEEMGMTGAGQLAPGFVRGQVLLNLDSEDDDRLYIGCAGGGDITLTWELDTKRAAPNSEAARVTVSGLRGGHSGGDIHENRGNAIKALVRTLTGAGITNLRVATITGGSKRNAIPREAAATVTGPKGTRAKLRKTAAAIRDPVAHESAEPNLAIHVAPVPPRDATRVLSADDSQRLLLALAALPSGVLEMHPHLAGLVQTSNNLATITAESPHGRAKLRLIVGTLARSSLAGRLAVTRDQIAAIGTLAGAKVEFGQAYPGWEPNMESPLLATCKRVYQQVFGQEPTVAAIHAGLECGILGQRLGKLDMISFGPRIKGAHSPDERVYIASVQKSYQYLTAVLAELARG